MITTRKNFDTDSDMDGREIWLDLTDDGRLTEFESKGPKTPTANSASCVCVTTTVEARSVQNCEFALAWHMPQIKFGLGQKLYSKLVSTLIIRSFAFLFSKMVYKMVR